MGKSVEHFWRYAQVAEGANRRLIDALANMSQDMVKLDLADSNSSVLMTIPENASFKYVVMPMRI